MHNTRVISISIYEHVYRAHVYVGMYTYIHACTSRGVCLHACALEWFDKQIGPILSKLRNSDLMIFTADHGNDPTWVGTGHTRERVPVLCAGLGTGELGQMKFQ